jgi:hypothetical protein
LRKPSGLEAEKSIWRNESGVHIKAVNGRDDKRILQCPETTRIVLPVERAGKFDARKVPAGTNKAEIADRDRLPFFVQS